MKLQGFKRIIVEDFDQKDRNLVGKLAYAINSFADEITNALNNQISIEDNLNIIKKDFTITVDDAGNVIGTGNLKTDLDHNCQGVMVIRATNLSNSSHTPTGTPFITFTEKTGIISISKITNLQASERYKLKLVLF